MTPSEEFGQLRLKFTDPIQHEYEVIRPIVLFSETISERSSQTGIERTRVGEKAQRFVQQGMFGLVDQRAGKAGRNPTNTLKRSRLRFSTSSRSTPRSTIAK
jgi:hypothetical protein